MIEPFSTTQRQALIAFHGHTCPGLAYGIKAAELCLQRLGHHRENALICLTETDMCAVDAIQFLTGCTYGKGNLIHQDWGKNAFTFWRTEDGHGFRAQLKERQPDDLSAQAADLQQQWTAEGDPKVKDDLDRVRQALWERILTLAPDALFSVDDQPSAPPRPARILASHTCSGCGEQVMESRVRLLSGQSLCIPCFDNKDQKR